MTGYHVTKRRNRLAIKRWGLIPRDTTKHRFSTAEANRGVERVFVFGNLQAARDWRNEFGSWEEEDIWAVDLDGVSVERDPYSYGYVVVEGVPDPLAVSLRVSERLTPERLELLKEEEE